MANNNQRGRNNNNAEGRNQYSNRIVDSARERPATVAVAAAAAVGAGVFLWSRREQISDQLSQLSEQIGEWSQHLQNSSNAQPSDERAFETVSTSGTDDVETFGESESPSAFGATSKSSV